MCVHGAALARQHSKLLQFAGEFNQSRKLCYNWCAAVARSLRTSGVSLADAHDGRVELEDVLVWLKALIAARGRLRVGGRQKVCCWCCRPQAHQRCCGQCMRRRREAHDPPGQDVRFKACFLRCASQLASPPISIADFGAPAAKRSKHSPSGLDRCCKTGRQLEDSSCPYLGLR